MSFIERAILPIMMEANKYFSVLTVIGPRQSGKTTLIRYAFKHLHYYSMENLDIRAFAANDPMAFLMQHEEGMILDEVQRAPQLLSYIQGIVDDTPSKRFILSGSSQFSVIKEITQSLAGRTAVFELLPLSFSEVRESARIKSLDKLLLDGFYPAIYAERNIASMLYPSYVKTYLERDVRDLLNVKDMMLFHAFMRLIAGRIGSLFNASEMAGELGVSVNTIKSWLAVLQASYIVMLLSPYHENSAKRLTKNPKLYFCDTGLACYLLGIETEQQLARDKMRGHLFENLIVMEALKARYNGGKDSNLFFYRDSSGVEVDLLLKYGSDFKAYEIKSSQTYHPDFEKGLKSITNFFGDRLIDKTVLYAGEFENSVGEIKLLNYEHFM